MCEDRDADGERSGGSAGTEAVTRAGHRTRFPGADPCRQRNPDGVRHLAEAHAAALDAGFGGYAPLTEAEVALRFQADRDEDRAQFAAALACASRTRHERTTRAASIAAARAAMVETRSLDLLLAALDGLLERQIDVDTQSLRCANGLLERLGQFGEEGLEAGPLHLSGISSCEIAENRQAAANLGACRAPSAERRTSKRAPIELRVTYQQLNTLFADYARNISRGGTFIATEQPLGEGTEFVFVLVVPRREVTLRLRGRVVWVADASDATPANPAGMGIEFDYEDEGQRSLAESRIEGMMCEELGTELTAGLLDRPPSTVSG